MKKTIMTVLALLLVLSLAACAVQEPATGGNGDQSAGTTTPVETEPKMTMETDAAKIDGFFVDDSHQESDGKPLKMVYLFVTFKPSEKNYKVDASYTKMTIGENEYESVFYKDACMYMPSYYYSSFLEEVFVGNEQKLALTFKVPEGDLAAGKEVTLADSDIPLEGLRFTTDDLVHCEKPEDIGAQVDAEACAKVVYNMQEADKDLRDKVRKGVNGYYWTFYVSVGTNLQKYELEFAKSNKFELRTPLLTNSGTYEVHNGYIFLYYKTSDTPKLIPYELIDGEVKLYCDTAFSIYE